MRPGFLKGIFLFLMTLLSSQTFAQLKLPKMVEVSPQTPNTAAFGKFGNYPVTLNTGLIDISIPIYEIKTSKLSVPIKLSYHASGIKVNEVSTWAGLGWSVIAGGSVSRTVVGRQDEHATEGYLSTASTQEIKDVGQTSYDKRLIVIQEYMEKIENGAIDPEPDVFSYNFLGTSGRFMYNRDKTTLIRIPFDKSKVNVDFTNGYITITETDGTFFRFGKGLDGTDYKEYNTFNNSNGQPLGAPTNWPLTTIISPDKKDTIQFKYTTSTGNFIADSVERLVVYTQHQGPQVSLPTGGTNDKTVGQVNNDYIQALTSEILFRNGKIVFENVQDRTDISNEKRLNAIKVYNVDPANNSYVLQKTVQFHQSYFDSQRMRLDSVSFTAPGALQAQVYRYEYNSEQLPARLSKARDWWGYYNGVENSSLLPAISLAEGTGYWTYNTGVNREVNSTYSKARTLEKITYPTGGYTEFEYQSNKYLEGTTTKTAGGLRIRQTRSYDGINPTPMKKTYVYGDGWVNTAPQMAYSNVQNFYVAVNELAISPMSCGQPNYEEIKVNCFTSNPTINLNNYDGSAVLYPWAAEYEGDPTNHQGYTIYSYQSFMDNAGAYAFPNKTYREDNSWRRGQLLSQTTYNKEGYPVTSVNNTYSSIVDTLFVRQGILIGRAFSIHTNSCIQYMSCSGCTSNALSLRFSFANYSVRSGLTKLTQSVTKTYDQNDPSKYSVVTTAYSYDMSSYQPSVVETTNSIGEKLVTNFKYPDNYNVDPNSTDAITLGIKLLKTSNVLTIPVETYQQRRAANNTLRTIGGVFNTFRSDIPVLSSAYKLDLSGPITDFTPSAVSGSTVSKDSRYNLAVTFSQYDGAGNLVEQNKANDVKQSFIWGYNKMYPVVQVIGETYSNIIATSNLNASVFDAPASDQAIRDEVQKIRQAYPNAQVTAYTYKPHIGITSVTDLNNRTNYYEYDEFGRLKILKDKDGNIVKTVEYKYKQ